MSADFGMGWAITGADEVARSLQSVAGNLERLTQKQQQNTQSTRQMSSAAGQANQGLAGLAQQGQQTAQRVQGVASSVQSLVGQLGGQDRTAGLVGSVAASVAQFSQMGGMLGPGGAVLGGLAGFAVAVIAAVRHQTDLATRTAEASEALRDQATAAGEARTALNALNNLRAAAEGGDLASTALTDLSDEDLRRMAEERRTGVNTIERLGAANPRLMDAVENGVRVPTGGGGSTTVPLAERPGSSLTGATEAVAALGGAGSLEELRAQLGAVEDEIRRRYDEAGRITAEAGARTIAELVEAGEERLEREENANRRSAGAARDHAEELRTIRNEAMGVAIEEADRLSEEELAREVEAWAREDEARRQAAEDSAATMEMIREAEADAMDQAAAKARDMADAQRELTDAAMDTEAAFSGGYVNSIEAVVEAYREANEAAKDAGRSIISNGRLMERGVVAVGNSIAETIGGTMVGAFEKALGAWLDGSKSFVEAAEEMVKGVLKALVIESVVQAVTETARGIADLASYRYDSGALHLAAAGAWAAVGIAAGAVGAGIGAFGGGGAGAGGGAAQAPTSRELAGQQGEGAGGSQYTINLYPGGYITRDEVSGGMVDALNFAARNGRTVDRRLVRR